MGSRIIAKQQATLSVGVFQLSLARTVVKYENAMILMKSVNTTSIRGDDM